MSARPIQREAVEPEADADADDSAQPLTPEEELAIGDLGNDTDDCGLLAQARAGQRELDLDHLAAALHGWERRRGRAPIE